MTLPTATPARARFHAWQWVALVLIAGCFAALLASEQCREEAAQADTLVCEVLTRQSTVSGLAETMEADLVYRAVEARPQQRRVRPTPAGSDGKLWQYQFPVAPQGLSGLILRAPGRVELVRFYNAQGQSVARLAVERFRPGPMEASDGLQIVLRPAADGSSRPVWISARLTPAASSVAYMVRWVFFYTAIFTALAACLRRFFASGGSLEVCWPARWLRPWAQFAHRAAPAQWGLVVGLTLAMATVSAYNAHPDEYLHCAAARYYRADNWLPPAADDRRVQDSYSRYGVTYLQELDVVYALAGKFSLLTGLLAGKEHLALRLFNVCLFAGLAALACRSGRAESAWPLLVCPQLWYIFGYFNADAFAFFASMLLVWQLGPTDSLLHRFLREGRSKWTGAAWAGCLLGVISISKTNYYPILLLAMGFAGWMLLGPADFVARRKMAQRWIAVFALAAVIFAVRTGYDQWLYRFEKAARIGQVIEMHAQPGFKTSELAHGGYWGLNLRGQGVGLAEMMTAPRWREESFMSFSGMYHWMDLAGPPLYYRAMAYLYLALAAAVFWGVMRKATRREALLAIAAAGICAATVFASVWHSWVGDFQPQGRYLFAILPIFVFIGLRCRQAVTSPAVVLLGAAAFTLSLYSFVFVALAQIPK